MINKGTIVRNPKRDSRSLEDDLETRSEHCNKLANNGLPLPLENSDVKPDSFLKQLKNDNNGDFIPHDSAFCLPIINYSREFDTVCSAPPTTQGSPTVSGTCEEVPVYADNLMGRTYSKPESSFPLNVECTQCDDVNRKKRKRRNKARKGRSTEENIESLQEEDRAAVRERRKMVAAVSVFAAGISLSAVLLIVVTLHMSQTLRPKGLGMAGVAENLTAGDGAQDDHKMLHDIATHLGADTREDGDNAILTQLS